MQTPDGRYLYEALKMYISSAGIAALYFASNIYEAAS
jgi:hypothetical protein